MQDFCYRCGGELAVTDGSSSFCPHCGSPQLYLPEQTPQLAMGEDAASTGVLPPPRPRQVEWRTAIWCAVGVAAVAAVLSLVSARVPALVLLSWLWTVGGAGIVMGLYQRRRPEAWVDAGIGARIGIVSGLTLVIAIALAMAVAGLVSRYSLHSMAAFDAQMTEQLEKAAAMNPQPAEAMRFIRSPEFRAGIMLSGFAMLAGFVTLLSAVGGALSGLLRTRRH